MTGGTLLRQGAVFAAAFFTVNMVLNAWRTGAVTPGTLSSAAFSTAVVTPLYVLAMWFLRRRRDGE